MAQADLAMTYLTQGEIEGSLTTTDQALQTAEAIASQRVLDRVGVLQRQLRRYIKHRGVADADERISRFLAGTTRPADTAESRPDELA